MFSPLTCLGIVLENQLIINVRAYFWTLNSNPLICMSVLMPVPHCLVHCSFIVNFEIRKWEFSNFVLLFFSNFYIYIFLAALGLCCFL